MDTDESCTFPASNQEESQPLNSTIEDEYKNCCTDDSISPSSYTNEDYNDQEPANDSEVNPYFNDNEEPSNSSGPEGFTVKDETLEDIEQQNMESAFSNPEEANADEEVGEETVATNEMGEGGEGKKCSDIGQWQYVETGDKEDEDASPKTFKIFVSNLPPGLQNLELRDLFVPFGEVVECEIFAKNYAFVHMTSEYCGVQAILELNGFDLRGCRINVKRSVNAGKPKTFETPLEVHSFKLFVGNLQVGVTKDFIEKLLEPFGRVIEVEISQRRAFVHMETEEGGKQAIEQLNGTTLSESEKPLIVNISTNTEGPKLSFIKMKISNVSPTVTAQTLRSLFIPYGLVLKAKIFPKVVDGGRSAEVLLEQFGNIRSAIRDLNNKEIEGNKIAVEPCFHQEKKVKDVPKKLDNEPLNAAKSFKPAYSRPDFKQREQGFGRNKPNWPKPFSTPPAPPPQFNQPPTMRLIPMPSQEEIRRCPPSRAGRGRILMRPPPLMEQEPFSYFQQEGEGHSDYPFNSGNNDNYNFHEVGGGDSYFGAQDYNHSDFSNQMNDFEYPTPAKIPRNAMWNRNNSMTNREAPGSNFNFAQHQNYETGHSSAGSFSDDMYPNFPSSTQFPKAPPSLMSLQMPASTAADDDWTSDIQLSNFSEFSSKSDAPTGNRNMTLNAVPFDYAQISNKKKNLLRNNRNEQFRPRQNFNHGGNNGQQGGKGKKGKSKSGRRPGLGTAQQIKKAAQYQVDQVGIDPSSRSGNEQVTNEPSYSGGTAAAGEGQQHEPVSSSTASNSAPYFQKQKWPFKKFNNRNRRPSAKELKDIEEDQKREYADYLKQKPWLYHAIPGTVKKVNH